MTDCAFFSEFLSSSLGANPLAKGFKLGTQAQTLAMISSRIDHMIEEQRNLYDGQEC